MAEAAAHHKQMENLMTAETFWKLVKYRQLKTVKDASDSVNDAACQKPSESCGRKSGYQWFKYQHTGPAHGDIDDGAYPVRTIDDKYFKADADDCS